MWVRKRLSPNGRPLLAIVILIRKRGRNAKVVTFVKLPFIEILIVRLFHEKIIVLE